MSEKPLPRIFRQDSCLTLDSSASYKEACSTTPSSFINGPLETASTFSIREPRPSDAASSFCILAEPTDLSVADGGRTAWLTVLGSVLVFYSSFGIINSFGFFQDYYSHEFLRDTAPSTIAFVGTLQIGLMNVLSTVSGALCDEYGLTASILLSFVRLPGGADTDKAYSGFTSALGQGPQLPSSHFPLPNLVFSGRCFSSKAF
jgi:hypothetical protein